MVGFPGLRDFSSGDSRERPGRYGNGCDMAECINERLFQGREYSQRAVHDFRYARNKLRIAPVGFAISENLRMARGRPTPRHT